MAYFDQKSIDGEVLRAILISGANNLFNHYPEVDALNVFPVPDGDTGTNMNLTITSGSKEIMNIRDTSIGSVAKIFSRGLLMGARGNSGVILSQIFRGLAQRLTDKNELDVMGFAEAWKAGSDMAYKAVMRPVEGTILTVIRESSEALSKKAPNMSSIGEAMEYLLDAARDSLKKTPDLLPVLKEVGVVDSGGAGLVTIMEGMLLGLKGDIIERKQISMPPAEETPVKVQEAFEKDELGYCVEIVLQLSSDSKKREKFNQERFVSLLQSLGNSLVIVIDKETIKIHLHTLKPGVAMNYAQLYGEFKEVKVENMEGEYHHKFKESDMASEAGPVVIGINESTTNIELPNKPKKKERSKYALVAVSVGDGLNEMFKNLGVDYIVSGGQSMNPSTQDFVKAIEELNAEHVYIFPNNKNIFMAAQQAADVSESCKVHVIPTKTIVQGLSACMMFNPDTGSRENEDNMTNAILGVKSGQVTFAIKDTEIDGLQIHKDYFMGILNTKDIVVCEKKLEDASLGLLRKMIDEESGLVTLIYGDGADEDDANLLAEKIEEEFGVEVEVHNGGQPVYSYFFGVE